MSDFQVPAGTRIHTHAEPTPAELARAEPGPIADATMRYLSRPPMCEPPARPMIPQMIFAGPGPALVRRPTSPPVAPEPAAAMEAPMPTAVSAVEVRRMVESLLRLTLEVVDRRRRPEQLKGMATQSVIDALSALAVSGPPGRELGTATLRKIRIVSAGQAAAEVSGSYARGPRVFAVAGRIERRRELWVATTLLLA